MSLHCPLENLTLRVELCPISACMYRSRKGKCRYSVLAVEEGTPAQVIADTKKVDVHRVKAQCASAKDSIEIGLVIDKYAEYVRESFPESAVGLTEGSANSVNDEYEEESLTSRVLRIVFRLSDEQQSRFWDPLRYDEWRKRHEVKFDLRQLSLTLKAVAFQYAE